jgi:hypothetical protein
MSTKMKGYALRTFKNRGTGERFEGGKPYEFEPDAYANYLKAGLVGDKPTESTNEKPATKSADKGGATA